MLFSRYPWTWEGGARRGADAGGSSITSGEARDFLLGGCARRMACTACHDPHGADDRARLQALATPSGNHVARRLHMLLESLARMESWLLQRGRTDLSAADRSILQPAFARLAACKV